MSVEGPCFVIPDSMRGFPCNEEGRTSSNNHVQRSLPHAAIPGVRMANDRRDSRVQRRQSSSFNIPPSLPTSTSTDPVAWGVLDCLPSVMDHPRLRSVSSLVLSSDGEGEGSSSHGSFTSTPVRSLPRTGTTRDTRDWNLLMDGIIEASGGSASQPDTSLSQLPPPPSGTTQHLAREPSFPPPHALPGVVSNDLARLQSFPPQHDGLGGGLTGIMEEMNSWQVPIPEIEVGNKTGSVASRTWEEGRGGSSGTIFSPIAGKDSSETYGDTQAACPSWGAMRESDIGSEGAGGTGGEGTESEDSCFSGRRILSDRRPSFDELLAMIPGIPQSFQSPPAAVPSTEHELSSSPAPSKPTVRQGRSATRHESGRRKSALANRASKPRVSKKVHDAAGAAGPSRGDGGPIDVVKKAKRKAAIERYLYKKSRRQFADATRDASPSRSRPKAAMLRPRHLGKFVKTVPDFIPVTSIALEGSAEADAKAFAATSEIDGKGEGKEDMTTISIIKSEPGPIFGSSPKVVSSDDFTAGFTGAPPEVIDSLDAFPHSRAL